MAGVTIGIIMSVLGLYSIIKGKIMDTSWKAIGSEEYLFTTGE